MSASPANVVHPLPVAVSRPSLRTVFVRDLVLPCSIGVYDHEREAPQRVRINIDLAVYETDAPIEDDIANVVCYERIVDGVRTIVAGDHTNLVETLAEDVATLCLIDSRVRSARIRVEKIDVFADTRSVGVEIERFNSGI